MVKQVYIVKRDGRKDVVPDPTTSNQKPAKMMFATKGKEVKRVTFKEPVVKSGQAKPSQKSPKLEKNCQCIK